MTIGPGITTGFPILTGEQVASVARRGHTPPHHGGRVLYAAGERGYDFIVIEAAEVDVLRPAMPNAPEALFAAWGSRSLVADRFRIRSGAPTSTHGAVVAGEPSVVTRPPMPGAHPTAPPAGGPVAAGTRSSR